MKKTLLISVLILLPLASFAAIDIQKQKDGASLTTANNFYVAGNMVNVFQKNSGDVYAAGNIVSITGDVEQDLMVAGSNVNITSEIGGDVRAAGANLNVNGPIGGDLLVFGGQIELAPLSVVGGDLVAGGGKLNIAGTVKGNAKIGGDEVYVSGVLNKDAEITAKRLVIEKTAVIKGNINYKGEEEAVVAEGAAINGEISFTKVDKAPKKAEAGWFAGFAALLGIFRFIKFLMLLVAALVLFFLLKRSIPKISAEAVDTFWKKVLRGFITLVIIPVAVIILFVTVIGALVGVFGLALFGLLILVASAFAGIVAAEMLNRLLFRGKNKKPLNWLMVILGVIAMELLAFVPIVGWIANFLLFLAAFGMISDSIFRQLKTAAK